MLHNHKKSTIILVLSCLFWGFLFSYTSFGKEQQERIEKLQSQLETEKDTNLVKALYNLSDEMISVDLEKSITYGRQSFDLAKQLNYTAGMAVASLRISSAYRFLGEFDLALEWAEISLKSSQINEDPYNEAAAYNELAIIHSKLGEFEQSLSNYLKAIKILEPLELEETVAQIQHNMGHLYTNIGDFEASKKNCLAALNTFERLNEDLSTAGPCNCLGDSYYSLDMIDSAVYYYSRCIIILEQNNVTSKLMAPLANMAMIYRDKGEYERALSMTKRASIISDSLGYAVNTAYCYQNIGEIYLAQGKLDSAIAYFERGGSIFRETGSQLAIMENYSAISEYFHLAGEDELAYNYLLKYNEVKDSVFNASKSQQILELKEKYETEQKEQKIAQLEADKKVDNAEIFARNILLAASSLLIIAFIFIVYLYLKRLQIKQGKLKIELEQKLLRAQINPHFVFNSLNSIQRMYIEGNLDRANDFLSDFGSLLRKILDNSGQTTVSVKEELDTLELYLEMEKMRTSDKINYTITISEEIDVYYLKIPPLIIQPLVENAIWHGILPKEGPGTIEISLKIGEKNTLICTVTDDGVGMQNKPENRYNKHIPKGIQITKDRLGLPNALSYSQIETGGTMVTMIIPKNHD